MARNASGTWSAPVGQPAIAGATITATAHNDLVTDVGTELTDSLSRSGKGGMLSAFKAVDGTVGGPGIAFNDEATTGIYRVSAGVAGFGVLGALVAKLTASGWLVNLVQSVTAATLSIKGAVADGASAVGVVFDNTVALANAGAKIASFRNAGVEKAYIDKDGNLHVGASQVVAPVAGGKVSSAGAGAGLWGATVARSSQGVYVITFATAQPDANYVAVVTPDNASPMFAYTNSKSTTEFIVGIRSAASTFTDSDFTFAVMRGA